MLPGYRCDAIGFSPGQGLNFITPDKAGVQLSGVRLHPVLDPGSMCTDRIRRAKGETLVKNGIPDACRHGNGHT